MTMEEARGGHAADAALEAHEGPWTVEELLARKPDAQRSRIELVGGALIVSPAPAWRHQKASLRLAIQIESAIEAAKAPYDLAEAVNVRTETQLFIPDIVVVDAAAVAEGPAAVDMEAVLLIVEIVSPGNAAVDRQLKPTVYAGLGLPHYWRLEPGAATPELIVHVLGDGRFHETVRITGTATVPVGDALAIDVDVPALFTPRDHAAHP